MSKKIKHRGIEVEITSEDSLYITIKGRCYYIENSHVMKGVSAWDEKDQDTDQVDWTVHEYNNRFKFLEAWKGEVSV